ncbi:sulfite oxidase [Gordonibacter sp.]|uniref:sulfite oxidase n=1 Tax=Gordonibacter sp. TaxID=1968902 RepID=UPI002FC8A661
MIGTLVGTAGRALTVEGYAQDFGTPIKAVQFSCDDGDTWASYPTPQAEADRNVNWSFSFTPPHAGHYDLLVRAVCKDGKTTPEPARVAIDVREGS